MGKKDVNALQLVNHSKVIIWSIDLNGTFITCTGKALTDIGFKDGEIVGKNFFELFKDHPAAIEGIKKAMAGEELDKDHRLGDKCYMNQIAPIRNDDGKIIGVAGVSTEITHRKKLQSIGERIMSLPLNMICLGTFEGHLTEVNPGFEQTLGHTPKDFCQNTYASFIHPEDLIRTKEMMEALKNGEKQVHFENRFRHKNGSYRTLEWTINSEPDTNVFYAMARDITDRKNAEIELKKERENLKEAQKQLFERIKERTELLSKAENDRLELIREQARLKEREYYLGMSNFLGEATRILGTSLDYQEALQNLTHFLIPRFADWGGIVVITREGKYERIGAVHKDPEKQKVLRAHLENLPMAVDYVMKEHKSVFRPEVTKEIIAKEAGKPGMIQLLEIIGIKSIMIVPILHRDQLLGTITLIRSDGAPYKEDDLTLIEELGRRVGASIENAFLYQSAKEAIESRDEFISMASHELKTPISSLKLQLQMTQRNVHPETGETIPAPKLMKALDNSSEFVNRLNALVEDLLDVTRIESGKLQYNFEQLDVSELTKKTVEQYKHHLITAGTQVSFETQCHAMIIGDRHRLEQVIVNLLTNAGKYGGKKPVEVKVRLVGNEVAIDVIDRGIGIPKEKIQSVFERFERVDTHVSASGLGLGLFIAKEIIRAHHGKMEVQSTPGMGSTFTFYLPLAPQH